MKLSRFFFAFFLFFSINIYTQAAVAKWNFLVYVAANNNLYRYALQDIAEMKQVGSNDKINIFAQLDNFGKKEVTRYKIEKGKTIEISVVKNHPLGVSGTPENLFDFAKEIITKHPAERQAIIFWDHGSGIKDPHIWSKYLPYKRDEFFHFNSQTKLFEIDRSLFNRVRGIAFNDVGRTYLTNEEIKSTLEKIKNELLGGKKIDLLGMDACHMAMVEIGSQIKDSATLMVGSQEIEPGSGWPYVETLKPFISQNLDPVSFARHIVNSYGERYNRRFADLTLSAVKLENYSILEKNIDSIAYLLTELTKNQKKNEFTNLIHDIRSKNSLTTSFLDTDYIDLKHFYKSLLTKINGYKPADTNAADTKIEALKKALNEGLALFPEFIIQNSSGPRATNANGLSIYFPTRTIHSSYLKTEFAKNTNWCNFLYTHLKTRRQELF